MIWGVDLGVRSFYAAGLDGDQLTLHSRVMATPKKVKEQPGNDRACELAYLAEELSEIVVAGDIVVIEEPPMAGSRNPRTFLRLAQTCGVLAAAACSRGAEVHFVPVDTWKMTIIGKGGVDKESVSRALSALSSRYSAQCEGNQNSVDATCIALYGRTLTTRGVTAEHVDAGLGLGGPQRRSA